MRNIGLAVALVLVTASPVAAQAVGTLVGVWRLVEVNALAMDESPPSGQLNRKEVYTAGGARLVARPDSPFSDDSDHFFFAFSDDERWYYARVTGRDAEQQQWEPRSVAVIRTNAAGDGTTGSCARSPEASPMMPACARAATGQADQ